MKPALVDASGRRWSWDRLSPLVPHELSRTPEHVGICQRVLEFWPAAERSPTLFNAIVTKSRLAVALTRLRAVLASRPVEPVCLDSPVDRVELERLLDLEIEAGIAVRPTAKWLEHLTARDVALWTAKVMLHRAWGRGGVGKVSATAIRGYNELAVRPFGPLQADATLLIFPGVRPERQRHAFRALEHLGWRPRRAGVKYRFRDVGRAWATRGARRIEILAEAEAAAGRAYGHALWEAGVRRLLATDEFDLSSYELHRAFRERGGVAIIGAHGAGLYSPMLASDEFLALSEAQEEYYRVHSPGMVFHRQAMPSVTPPDPGAPFEPGAVLIDQFATARHRPYEATMQDRLLEVILGEASAVGLPVAVKSHPNMRERLRQTLESRWGVPVCRQWAMLPFRHPIVFLINSTMLWELERAVPVFVLRGGMLRPDVFFGARQPTIGFDGIREAMERCRHHEGWVRQVDTQTRGGARAP
jgi:hypothetical protein